MKYALNVKTGFFTSRACHLLVDKGILTLSWDSSDEDDLLIKESSLSDIVLRKRKRLEIELTADEKIISGIFTYDYDPKELFDLLIDNLKTTTTYKEE